ncbi:M56 family metallopeptidase [Pirellulaceae bacterium SH449]
MFVSQSTQLFALNIAVATTICISVGLGLSYLFRSLPKRTSILLASLIGCLLCPIAVGVGMHFSLGKLPSELHPFSVSTSDPAPTTPQQVDVASNTPKDEWRSQPNIGQVPSESHLAINDSEHLRQAKQEYAPVTSIIAQQPELTKATRIAWYPSIGAILISIWAAGTVVLLIRQMWRLFLCRRFLRSCRPIEGAQQRQMLGQIKQDLKLDGAIDFLESDSLTTPIVVTWRIPTIVLPSDISFSLTSDQLHSVLAHELTHIQRNDHQVVFLQAASSILYWWNPLLYWASRRLSILREMICDDVVMSMTDRPVEYARSILQIAEQTAKNPVLVSSLGIGLSPMGELESRIRRILDASNSRADLRITRGFAVGLTAISALLITGLLFAQIPATQSANTTEESTPLFYRDNKSDPKQQTIKKRGKPDLPLIQFSGRVIDTDNTAVSNATVYVQFEYLEIDMSVATNDDGSFQLDFHLGPELKSDVKLWAEASDGEKMGFYRFQQYARDENENSSSVKDMEIRVEPIRVASIQVVDDAGLPIESANVALQLSYPNTMGPFQTDSAGQANIKLPISERILSVVGWKDFKGLDYRSYELGRGRDADLNAKAPEFPFDRTLTLRLDGATSLKVKVTDDAGTILRDVPLHLWLLQKETETEQLNLSYFNDYFTTKTDSNGEASFDWLPSWQTQQITVWPSAKGYERARGEYDPIVQQGNLNIMLNRSIPLRGKVSFPDGSPAAGISVLSVGAGYSYDNFYSSVPTDENGCYEILVSPNQIYLLAIRDNKWSAPSQSSFAVLPNQTVDEHDFQLRPATRVYGQVLSKTTNQPLANQLVYFSEYGIDLNSLGKDILPNPEGSNLWVAPINQSNQMTQQDGKFEFFVGDGEYKLFIQGMQAETIVIKGEPEKQTNLYVEGMEKHELVGRVVSNETDEPLADVMVNGIARNFMKYEEWKAVTDDDGSFKVLKTLEATTIHAINAERTMGAIQDISANDESVELRLTRLGSAKGRLLTEDGSEPASLVKLHYGVLITDQHRMSSNRFGKLITTDEDGYFSMTDLVPGWEYQCVLADYPGGRVVNVAKVMVQTGQIVDLGDRNIPTTPKPYVPPTLEEQIQEAFNVNGTPSERFERAVKQIELVNQNLIILFGKPDDPRVHRMMQVRYEDDSFRPYSDDFRIMAVPTDGDRLLAAQELAEQSNLNLVDGREAFHLLVFNKSAELIASAGIKQLCDGEEFSKDALFVLLDQHRTQPLDAQTLLDEALKKAAAENKRILVQETATWCGPCHQLSRLLMANKQWEQDYIWVKMDHRWTGAREIMAKLRDGASGGIPWFAILDSSGNVLSTSNEPESGDNIGFPREASGQKHFANMLKATRQRMTDAEIAQLVAAAANQQ